MHGLFPTLEQWDQLNHKTLSHRFKSSRQWDELDRAVRAFSVDQANESLFQQLKSATEAFVALKTKADGLFHTTRDSNGVISALRAFVADHAPTMSTAEHTAIREVILKNKQALFRGLVGAEIRYKPKEKIEMAKALKEDAEEFRDSLLEVPFIARTVESSSQPSGQLAAFPSPPGLPRGLVATQLKAAWDQILREACAAGEAIPDVVLAELKTLIGRQLCDSLSSAIPYLGTIKEGAAVMAHLKNIAQHELTTYRVKSSKAYVRPGDVQAAVESMLHIFSSDRIDLGIELASSSATFAAGVGTLGADGGAFQVITSLATTGAKLIRTIYLFVSQHTAMTRANTAIRSSAGARMPLLETLQTFPFLGAYTISILETSTILDINIADINQPFFKHLAQDLSRRVDVVKTSARAIIEKSRFEVVNTDLCQLEIIRSRESFTDSLQAELDDALLKREMQKTRRKMDAVIREIPAAAAKFQERRDRSAHEAKFKAIAREAAGKISLLEMMMLANLELESYMAALIDIRAMEEQRQVEMRRNKSLATRVQAALASYSEQTTGFRRFTTRQSSESSAALQALHGLVSAQNFRSLAQLRGLTEYLLKVTPSAPDGLPPGLRQLNNGSRLHGLLTSAYQGWAASST